MKVDYQARIVRVLFWICLTTFAVMVGMMVCGMRTKASWLVLISLFLNLLFFYSRLPSRSRGD